MITFAQFGAAIVLIGIGAGMAFYEGVRIKAGRPILNGRESIQYYWMTYLLLLVLGGTLGLAAIVR